MLSITVSDAAFADFFLEVDLGGLSDEGEMGEFFGGIV